MRLIVSLVAILSVSLSSYADQLPQGQWAYKTKTLEVEGSKITYDGVEFVVDQQTVVKTYIVGSEGFLSGKSTECRMTMRTAKVVDDKVVLLEATFSKNVSTLEALLCPWVQAKDFSKAYMFTQFVVQFTEYNQANVIGIKVPSSLKSPMLTLEELVDPSIAETLQTDRSSHIQFQLITVKETK